MRALAPIFAPTKSEKCLEREEKPTEKLARQAILQLKDGFSHFAAMFGRIETYSGYYKGTNVMHLLIKGLVILEETVKLQFKILPF